MSAQTPLPMQCVNCGETQTIAEWYEHDKRRCDELNALRTERDAAYAEGKKDGHVNQLGHEVGADYYKAAYRQELDRRDEAVADAYERGWRAAMAQENPPREVVR